MSIYKPYSFTVGTLKNTVFSKSGKYIYIAVNKDDLTSIIF
jgi:hypothetical protein